MSSNDRSAPARRSAFRPHQVSIMAPMDGPLVGPDYEDDDENDDDEEEGENGEENEAAEEAEDEDDDENEEGLAILLGTGPFVPLPALHGPTLDPRDLSATTPTPPGTISPISPVATRSRNTSAPSGASRPPSPTTSTASNASFEVLDPDIPIPSVESDAVDCETRLRAARRDARRSINRAVRGIRASDEDGRWVRGLLEVERRRVRELTRRLQECEEHGREQQQQLNRQQVLINNLALEVADFRGLDLADDPRRVQQPQPQHQQQAQQAQAQPHQHQQQQQAPVARRQQPARRAKRPVSYRPGRG
ncbi:MAG: hypothetical protein Q9187_001516 [Circinaria calcarea]